MKFPDGCFRREKYFRLRFWGLSGAVSAWAGFAALAGLGSAWSGLTQLSSAQLGQACLGLGPAQIRSQLGSSWLRSGLVLPRTILFRLAWFGLALPGSDRPAWLGRRRFGDGGTFSPSFSGKSRINETLPNVREHMSFNSCVNTNATEHMSFSGFVNVDVTEDMSFNSSANTNGTEHMSVGRFAIQIS